MDQPSPSNKNLPPQDELAVLGTADAETIAAWGEVVDPGSLDLAAEALKIRGLGSDAIDGAVTNGGGVIETSEGVPTGRVFKFGETNLGDHIKVLDKVADPSTGDEVATEEGSRTVLNDVEENIDLLLNGDTLKTILDGQLDQEADPALVYEMKMLAEKRVLGPEQAVLIAKKMTKELGVKTIDQVHTLMSLVGGDETDEQTTSLVRRIDSQLPNVRAVTNRLIGAIDGGEKFDDYHRQQLRLLIEFAEEYGASRTRLSTSSEDAVRQTVSLPSRSEELSTALRQGKNRADEATLEALDGRLDPELRDQTMEAVIERGASTVESHRDQATQQAEQQVESITVARKVVRDVEAITQEIASGVLTRDRIIDDLPASFVIVDLVDMIRSNVASAERTGVDYSMQIGENLHVLRSKLSNIEQSIQDTMRVGSKLSQIRPDAQIKLSELLRSPIYAAL